MTYNRWMRPDVALRRWYYFIVLAKEMSFTRAAEKLYISQPSLSQQIRVLERELGVTLLDRDGPRFQLTSAGRVAATEAADLLDHVNRAHQRVHAAARGATGRLRLAHTRSAPGPRASDLVTTYRRRYPGIVIESEMAWTRRNIARLEADDIDLAFVRPPIDSALVETEIVDVEEVLIALPDNHPLVALERLDRHQIANELVVFWPRASRSGWYDDIRNQIWPHHGPKIVWEEPDDEQLMHAVAAGAGITAIPEHRARVLAVPGLTLRHLTDPVPRTSLALAYRRCGHNPLVQNFLELARTMAHRG